MMRRVLFAVLGVLALWSAAAPAAAPDADTLDRFRALAARGDAVWDAGDAPGMADLYTADADLRLGGMDGSVKGRSAVRDYFTQSFAKRPADLRHVTRITHAEMVGPDMAFVDNDVRLEQKGPDGAWTLLRSFKNYSLVVRDGDGWKLRAVRAVVVPNPAP